MAKTKSTKKATKNKAKQPGKPAKAGKAVKKSDKKSAKKPVSQAKLKAEAAAAKKAQAKIEAKKAKEKEKAAKLQAKLDAKAQKEAEKAQAKAAKAEAKLKAKAAKAVKKTDKKSDDEFEDDLVGEDFGDSEIAEYEEDLKAVEDEDDDTLVDDIEEDEEEKKDEEVYLTDSEGRRLCRVRDCDQVSSVDGYCRYHYLLLWKKIQTRKHILNDGKLEKYIEDLTSRYPDKFLEVIKKDVKTEKDFLAVIQEMELDENALAENENEDEVQSFTDEIRGIGEAPSMDEDGDSF